MLTNDENTLPTHIAKIPNGAEAIRKNIRLTVNLGMKTNRQNMALLGKAGFNLTLIV